MAIGPDCRYCPKCGWEARREDVHRYSGELWLDSDGTANFKWHIEGGDFKAAREALVKFIECLQQRLNGEGKCPMYGMRVNKCSQCGKEFLYSYEADVCPKCFRGDAKQETI